MALWLRFCSFYYSFLRGKGCSIFSAKLLSWEPAQGREKCSYPGLWHCFAPTPVWYPPELAGLMGCQAELRLSQDECLLYRPQQIVPQAVRTLSALSWPRSIKSWRVSKKGLTCRRPGKGPLVSAHTSSVSRANSLEGDAQISLDFFFFFFFLRGTSTKIISVPENV